MYRVADRLSREIKECFGDISVREIDADKVRDFDGWLATKKENTQSGRNSFHTRNWSGCLDGLCRQKLYCKKINFVFMRNIFIFYCVIAVPLFALVLSARMHLVSSTTFALLMFLYIFVYHPLMSALRLIGTKKIPKNKFWMNFIPFWNWKYKKDLCFSNRLIHKL